MTLFDTMSASLLQALGRPSLYNGGSTPVRINIENGVQMAGIGSETAQYRGDYVAQRDVATISATLAPKAGDTFTQDGVQYRLEALLRDNGSNRRFIIQKVTPP
jgi:hypothetical protein